jgi:hypothetical protein
MAKYPAHILELAKVGAEIQLRDMIQEIRYLLELFPHLRDSFTDDELPLNFLMAERGDSARARPVAPSGRRRQNSAAARRPIGGGTKKNWSARRQSNKS